MSGSRALPVLLTATVLTGLLFAAVPEIDLWLAERLYDRANQRFAGGQSDLLALYGALRDGFVLLPILAAIMAGLAWRWPARFGSPRRWLFALLAMASLGPLVADLSSKPVFQRPRPKAVVEFGGTQAFQPAFAFGGECRRNCSFVSSDVAVAASLLAPALLLRRHRRWAIGAALGLTALTAIARLAAGAHFLSDVVFAALSVWILVLALGRLLPAVSPTLAASRHEALTHPLLAPPDGPGRAQR
ncbi:MAG: phosphatase PAP2 family protein [Alphaproteobacteria bacterium]|nr:phosphatase PAP2 family protein [Alphaproteobacteria bacterium]